MKAQNVILGYCIVCDGPISTQDESKDLTGLYICKTCKTPHRGKFIKTSKGA